MLYLISNYMLYTYPRSQLHQIPIQIQTNDFSNSHFSALLAGKSCLRRAIKCVSRCTRGSQTYCRIIEFIFYSNSKLRPISQFPILQIQSLFSSSSHPARNHSR